MENEGREGKNQGFAGCKMSYSNNCYCTCTTFYSQEDRGGKTLIECLQREWGYKSNIMGVRETCQKYQIYQCTLCESFIIKKGLS